MANSKGPASVRNLMYNARNPLLPPKSPFPCPAPSYVDYVPSSATAQKTQKFREGNSHHQRTSSESQLIDEQPSWLDELLNEPETPVRRSGHRRSSSDSFAYIDAANAVNLDYASQNENKFKHMAPLPTWGSQDFDLFRDAHHASFIPEPNSSSKHKNRAWDSNLNLSGHSRGFPSPSNMLKNSGVLRAQQETDVLPSTASEREDAVESGPQVSKGSSEKKDSSHGKSAASDTDTKRAKQQFAQRSRVRKLQYIAELERNVQALQAEGSEVSAELEFVNQQNLILSMENKALKQRLESLAQEQLIKYLEHEVLEREIVRLRAVYQQQQQPTPSHRRKSSKDLDQQIANLSLKQKDASSARDNSSGQLHI